MCLSHTDSEVCICALSFQGYYFKVNRNRAKLGTNFLNQYITDVLFYNILIWSSSVNPPEPSCGVKDSGFKKEEFRHKSGFLTSLTISNSWNKLTNNWHLQQRRGIIKVICLGPNNFFGGTVQLKAKTHPERMRHMVPQTDSLCSPALMRIRWGTWYTTAAQPHTHNIKRLHLTPVVGKDLIIPSNLLHIAWSINIVMLYRFF